MRLVPAILLASLTPYSVFGQTYTISTFAGGGLPTNIPGTSANIGAQVNAVAIDAKGNVFIATGAPYSVVLRLDAVTGLMAVVAGTGTAGFSGDGGPATVAQLYYPHGVALDSAGNLYIADYGNNRIRKVSNGVITTVAGGGSTLGDNGPATSAQLPQPYGVAVDSAGNLYVATLTLIRKVSNGVITTVAGNGTSGFSGDGGPATSAQLRGLGILHKLWGGPRADPLSAAAAVVVGLSRQLASACAVGTKSGSWGTRADRGSAPQFMQDSKSS
jgi:hypothetical protein